MECSIIKTKEREHFKKIDVNNSVKDCKELIYGSL